MLTYFFYFATFVTGVLLFELVASTLLRRRERSKALNRRMALVEDTGFHDATGQLRLERGLHPLGAISMGNQGLQRLYTQSGLTIRLSNLALIAVGAGAVASMATNLFFGFALGLQILVFAGVAVALPFMIMLRARRQRILTFTRQLPDALDVVVRSLQAGHPFPAAVGLVAREMPDPIGSEFGILSDEMGYGITAESALANMLERVGAEDLQLVIVSLSINRTSGGNLAEVIENLSHVIRERFLMKAKIRSLSAEGRFSAKIMTVFPLLLYMLIVFMAPNYFDEIWEAGIEYYFFGFCVVMTLIGNIIIRRMVNLDF